VYRRDKTPEEIADMIERFVYREPSTRQWQFDLEWNDLLDCGVKDPELNAIVKQCELINREYLPQKDLSPVSKQQREDEADERLKLIAIQLRNMKRGTKE
jgi:hypothetical protein